MRANERQSNRHLMTLMAILIVLMMALLTAVILMRSGDRSPKSLHAKLWKSPKPESSRPPSISSIPASKSTGFPTTVTTKKPRNVCESPECITLAHQLHNWRDPSVDPCQDFFRATCGKYNEHSFVKGSRMSKKSHIVRALIEEFLQKNQSTVSKSENAMKLLYGKCKDYQIPFNKEIENNATGQELFAAIQKLGPWPVLDRNWNESDFDLNGMTSRMAQYGALYFGFFKISPSHILRIIPYTYRISKVFEQHVPRFLKEMNIEPDIQMIKDDARDFAFLEEELWHLNSDSEEEMTFSELQAQVPSIDFKRIIKSLANPISKKEIWNKIKNKIITKKHPIFFNETKNLETILKTTSNRTLANFLIFHFTIFTLSSIPERMNTTECESEVMKTFPLPAIRIFVQRHFDKEHLKITSNMVDNIKKSLIEIIQESSWLHDETKGNAIRKVEMMKKMIGYPDELEKPGALDKSFEALNLFSNDSYFIMRAKIQRFEIEQSLDHVALIFPMESTTKVLEANALYKPGTNWLSVNIPIMDDPFFDSTYPEYAKIASIGAVIGHEIGHGFDPDGRKRDENGKERDWWTPEDSEEYEKRAQCFVEQYNEYDDPSYGKNLNGLTTIDEIVSDVIGVDVSWKTYKKLDLSNEPSIIGFEDYSIDKLFFRLTALNWCSHRDTAPLEVQLNQVHPTKSFRVNGVYSNMKSFAKTFNCPIGTPMNPEKKCVLF